MPFPLTAQDHRNAGCTSNTALTELRMIIQSLSLEGKLSDVELFDRLNKVFQQVIFCDADVLFARASTEAGRKLNLFRKVQLLLAITREMDNLRQSYRPPARNERSPGDRREPGLAEGQESLGLSAQPGLSEGQQSLLGLSAQPGLSEGQQSLLGLSAQPGFPSVTRATAEDKEPVEGSTWPPELVDVIQSLLYREYILRTAQRAFSNERKFIRWREKARTAFMLTLIVTAILLGIGGSLVGPDRTAPGGLSEDSNAIFLFVMGSLTGLANLTSIGVEIGTRCKQSCMVKEVNDYLLGLIPEAAGLSAAELRERASRLPAYRTAVEENIWKELADKVKQILGKSQENPQGLKPEEVCCTICTGPSNEEKGKIGMVRIVPSKEPLCFEGPLHRSCMDEWRKKKPDSSPICREPYYKDRDGALVFWELDRAIATLESKKGGQRIQATLETPPRSDSVSVAQLTLDIPAQEQRDEKQKEKEAAETKRTLASHQRTLTHIVTTHDQVHQTGETTIAMTSLISGPEEETSEATPHASHQQRTIEL